MKSILENRPELAQRVAEVAEVAGYLWQKGWAERNGGNITVNVTAYADDEIRSMSFRRRNGRQKRGSRSLAE